MHADPIVLDRFNAQRRQERDLEPPTREELLAARDRAWESIECTDLLDDMAETEAPLMAALRARDVQMLGRILLNVAEARAIRVAECELYGASPYNPSPLQAACVACIGGAL